MKKPAKDAPILERARYRAWVREQLREWDPADDRSSPDCYIPRFNGVRAIDVENARDHQDADADPAA